MFLILNILGLFGALLVGAVLIGPRGTTRGKSVEMEG